MADTCIVCLGDLNGSLSPCTDAASPTPIHTDLVPSLKVEEADTTSSSSLTPPPISDDDFIAHLLPCGHNLHDSCLRPWVERANSCPICRAVFNMVELRHTLHGPTVSSYAVQDKAQVAELDPSMIIDDDDPEAATEACMICESFTGSSQLLSCDGCHQTCHVACAGFDRAPLGVFLCYDCQEDPRTSHSRSRQSVERSARRRMRQVGVQSPNGRDGELPWALLWRNIHAQTNIDLDFPFDEEESTDATRAARRREMNDWRRRLNVVQRQAGPAAAERLRQIAPVEPEVESQEELRAWNAFEKARIILEENQQRETERARRKRKSPSSSPDEARPAQPERKRKRPRTLRFGEADHAETSNTSVAESSRAPRQDSISAPRASRPQGDAIGGPTFLQSLLDEVKAQPSNSRGEELRYDVNGEFFPFGYERSASPENSPPGSSHATPRATTPPTLRPVSPMSLASSISPIFPPPPEFVPNSPPMLDSVERARGRQRAHLDHRSPASSPTRGANSETVTTTASASNASTPRQSIAAQHSLDLKTKTEIQTLVKTALKPLYQKQDITADEYTDINKSVSRRLYDLIGSEDSFLSAEKGRWQEAAADEVLRAVSELKPDGQAQKDEQIADGREETM